ncbi:hypothetical protein OG285_05830 [Streptomyces sp. NBC_01471]|uniref:hypothetical protein n=1 Tax=Streptomyces sp. NBC_01471 TaxID=2903879 RepID=UPI00324D59AF
MESLNPNWKAEVAITRARKALFASIIGALTASAGLLALNTANAEPQAATATAAADMPTTVETFDYPGADKIAADRQIVLKRGDGHIVLSDCAQPYDIMVKSRVAATNFCFTVHGSKGLLTLELPDAFGVWTEAHPVTATLTADGKENVVKAPANDYTPMGEAGDSGLRSVLVELRVTS